MKVSSNFKTVLMSAGLLIGSMAVVSNAAQASSFGLDLSLSDETANFGAFTETQTPDDTMRYAFHYFYNDPGDRMYTGSVDLKRKGLVGSPDLDLGVKGKLFAYSQKKYDTDGLGLMLGVTGRYWLKTQAPASISAEVLYGPKVVTTGDLNSAREFGIRGDMQLLSSVTVFVGFRYLEFDLKQKSDYEMDKNAHIGIEVKFD